MTEQLVESYSTGSTESDTRSAAPLSSSSEAESMSSSISSGSTIMASTSAAIDANVDATKTSSSSSNALSSLSQSAEASLASSFPNFLDIGKRTGTDKVTGALLLPACQSSPNQQQCRWKDAVNPKCRVAGHYYHSMYNQWLPKVIKSAGDEKFSALEIGFYHGQGYDAFGEYLREASHGAGTLHSLEISCIEQGPRKEGRWPPKHARYQELLDQELLHCGDASDYAVLHQLWTQYLKSNDAPLRLVIDDGSHITNHMAIALFFWFPRIAPGGILVMEDIEPLFQANGFREHVLPQVLRDLHYCGNDELFKERACFPTLQPFLQSVHCEMHICVFERNDKPAVVVDELSEKESMPPPHAYDARKCLFGGGVK